MQIMRYIKYSIFFMLIFSVHLAVAADAKPPILIGLTAGFGLKNSRTAQAIEKGVSLAIHEINASGGVLDGRPLKLITRDDRGLPARGQDVVTELADNPDVLAVFTGRFSPVTIAVAPIANARKILLLAPWSAADSITKHAYPNYVFRVSLTDSWALHAMLEHAQQRGFKKIVLFIPNTAWGRSCEQALLQAQKRDYQFKHIAIKYNLGEIDFRHRIKVASDFAADAIFMVSNEAEGAPIVQQIAELPAASRMPLVAHWGVLGGDFPKLAGDALHAVDFTLITTFSFENNRRDKAQQVAAGVKRLFDQDAKTMHAQPGFAHAYDLTHMLALAIREAGSAERTSVRAALEQLESYRGLTRDYHRPFSKSDHEGLDQQQVFIARYDRFGKVRKMSEH
ncbi:MAG: hypothetical protein B7Y16_08020 [Methylotenera sp. 24-45-7]|nr:MAG: hypothetical protein B7Y16_08020 [Methylotenera sp. 24-45-7]OZA74520.1 MAG: hypothetical protein B7X71_13230 [Polynucleobacter sp. 39-46-10]